MLWISATDVLRISITVWPECDVLAPVITRILPLMRSMLKKRCKRTSMSTRDMRLLGSSGADVVWECLRPRGTKMKNTWNWSGVGRSSTRMSSFWATHLIRNMAILVLFWLMHSWQLGDDNRYDDNSLGKDFEDFWSFLALLRLRVACLHFHERLLVDQVPVETRLRCDSCFGNAFFWVFIIGFNY